MLARKLLSQPGERALRSIFKGPPAAKDKKSEDFQHSVNLANCTRYSLLVKNFFALLSRCFASSESHAGGELELGIVDVLFVARDAAGCVLDGRGTSLFNLIGHLFRVLKTKWCTEKGAEIHTLHRWKGKG
jgi:hypothetical protein